MKSQITMCGVEGRLTVLPWGIDRAGTYMHQTFKAVRPFKGSGYPKDCMISVEVRFDDNCKNGHNSFAITGTIYRPGARDIEACGCLHKELAKHFPELAHLIRWHLFDQTGPMNYVANTVYLAGDRDCHGLRKGEQKAIVGPDGIPTWHLKVQGEKTFEGHEPPALPNVKWVKWCRTGEGKERELDAARRVAVWPEATDEQLSAEPEVLKAALLERLPALIASMRADVEAAGFNWEAPKQEVAA